jgi:hypothetical protein
MASIAPRTSSPSPHVLKPSAPPAMCASPEAFALMDEPEGLPELHLPPTLQAVRAPAAPPSVGAHPHLGWCVCPAAPTGVRQALVERLAAAVPPPASGEPLRWVEIGAGAMRQTATQLQAFAEAGHRAIDLTIIQPGAGHWRLGAVEHSFEAFARECETFYGMRIAVRWEPCADAYLRGHERSGAQPPDLVTLVDPGPSVGHYTSAAVSEMNTLTVFDAGKASLLGVIGLRQRGGVSHDAGATAFIPSLAGAALQERVSALQAGQLGAALGTAPGRLHIDAMRTRVVEALPEGAEVAWSDNPQARFHDVLGLGEHVMGALLDRRTVQLYGEPVTTPSCS